MALTAEYLVGRIRDLVQLFGGAIAFRDGFPADAGQPATPLLPSLNEHLGEVAKMGVYVGWADLPVTAGDAEYSVPTNVINIISAYLGDNNLRQTSREGLDERDANWNAASNGTPNSYFREGNRITLNPNPSASGTLSLRASLALPLLVAPTDVLLYVPDVYQLDVPYGAAVLAAVIDAENETHQKRIGEYKERSARMLASLAANFTSDYLVPISLDIYHRDQQTAAARTGNAGLAG